MRLFGLTGLLVCAVSCGGSKSDAPAGEPPPGVGQLPQLPASPSGPETPIAPPLFPLETRSLELTRTVGVRLQAGEDAKRIGTIAVDTRVGWSRSEPGKGCKAPWVEIRPRGWVCADYLKPSPKPPHGREVPILERGELVPGVYGKVTAKSALTYVVEPPPKPAKAAKAAKPAKGKAPRGGKGAARPSGPVTAIADAEPAKRPAVKLVEGKPLVGSVNVRQYEELTVAGKTYWRITKAAPEYVLKKAITQHKPSTYAGARFGDDTGWAAPIAFVWPRVASWGSATVMWKPTGGMGRQIKQRTPISILDTALKKDGKPQAYRIGPEEWIAASDVRLFAELPPPPTLQPGERWLDVDLDNQIVVAYEGAMPVYATMMSSGTKDHPTETGVYRMWVKHSEADMSGLGGEDPYSVATVPWTQFYSPERGLALHTAYWHDGFGGRKSRGCLNLAPRDARWLYFWSDPQVPPGWTMAAGVVEAPGSLIRVRSKADPDPPARGYAKKVLEARQQNAPVR